MSKGIPVISSLKGENQLVIDRFKIGFNYNAEDFEDFHSKLLIAYNNKDLLHEMKNNCLDAYNDNFRGNYAGIGNEYDPDDDIFYPFKPWDSWVKDKTTATSTS